MPKVRLLETTPLARALEANTALTHLTLESSRSGAEGAEHLTHALEASATVTHLNLCFNQIGDESTARMAPCSGGQQGPHALESWGQRIGV